MTDMTLARATAGRHFPAQGRALSASGIVPPLNKLIALPFDAGGVFDRVVAWEKFGGGADSVMRVGVFGRDVNGLPGDLIYDCGELETSNSYANTGREFLLDEPRLFDTPFWTVAVFGGSSAPTMLAAATMPSIEMQHLFGIPEAGLSTGIFNPATANCILADFTYDVMPSTFPTTNAVGGSALWLSMKTPA